MSIIKQIIELGRFRFLIGGFFIYSMGALLASVSNSNFSFILFIIGYAIMMPAHLSLSYSNNFFDQHVDRYNTPISISGGTKLLIEYPELKRFSKYIAIGLIITSILIAIIITYFLNYSIWFIAFIIFGNLLGWFYTAPPIRLAYRGLGEVANMINMAFLMPGIGYWIMNGTIDSFYLLFAIGFLFYGFEFMIIVESPDMEGDKLGHKKTLIVTKGRKNAYMYLLFALIIGSIYYLSIFYIGIFHELVNYFVIFVLSLLPISIAYIGWINKPFNRKISTKFAKINMTTLILFIILINIYFVLILIL